MKRESRQAAWSQNGEGLGAAPKPRSGAQWTWKPEDPALGSVLVIDGRSVTNRTFPILNEPIRFAAVPAGGGRRVY
ncbi:hypothetical protein GCM10023096_77670 [Nonomuraea ferruginea]